MMNEGAVTAAGLVRQFVSRVRLPRGDVPFCAAACLASLLVVLAAGEMAMVVPQGWLGGTPWHLAQLRTHFVDRFFPFDALWYQGIADDWYVWNPSRPNVQQDVAFFPLWPAVLWLLGRLGTDKVVAAWLTVSVAAGFAVASVAAFHRLADRVLPRGAARTATLLLALSPAANFLWQSYPTGLMNLLIVLALLALMDGKFLRAAAFSGMVTAAGPLGLGTALTVCACAFLQALPRVRQGHAAALARTVVWLVLVGVVSVGGLVVFLAIQQAKFGDAFAFMKAQEAWAKQLSWPARLLPFVSQSLVLPDVVQAMLSLRHVGSPRSLIWLHGAVQKSLYLALEAAAIVAVAASFRLRCRPVLLQGAFTMALFIWFHSTSRPGNSTPRLLYCVMAIFLGTAWLLRDRPLMARAAVGASACLLAGAAFLTVAGYQVT